MAQMDVQKQVVEALDKNFSLIDKNQDGKISKEEFNKYPNLGLPKLSAGDSSKYFDKLANNAGNKSLVEKGDLTLEKSSIVRSLSGDALRIKVALQDLEDIKSAKEASLENKK